jgi:ABC-type microcin C transport system permease subunit YejB
LGTTLLFGGTWIRNRTGAEIASFAGTSVVALSWWVFAQDVIWTAERTIAYPYMAVFAPIALVLFIGAERSATYARHYRSTASILLTGLSLQLLLADHAFANGVLVMLAGVPLATWGLIRKHRQPLLGGAAIATAGLCAVIASAVEHMTVNSWLLFAGLGVALVLVSSVIERYGRRALRSTLDAWADLSDWE